MNFWLKSEKKPINSAEFDLLLGKISNVSCDLDRVFGKIEIISTGLEDLRARFNRRLHTLKEDTPAPPEEKQNDTNIKPNVLLSPNGATL
jgi:hypothetical protein